MAAGGHSRGGAVPPPASALLLTGSDNRVTLIVDNTRFVVDPALFALKPETMLARMFGHSRNPYHMRPNERGEYEIAGGLSAAAFGAILEYYKTGFIDCPPSVTFPELREACDHLLIPFDAETVRCHNLKGLLHDLSDERARLQFEKFLEEVLFRRMVSAAQKGERECHIVVLLDDDALDWDEEFPPPSGDEHSQIIHSTAMYRFFKYMENRDVAKQVLRERGLNKIRLSMESFPKHKDNVMRRSGGRSEASYNYVQRPYLWVSWEEEETRSRHVDFERVTVKAVTNVGNPVALPSTVRNTATHQQVPRSAGPVRMNGVSAGGTANRSVVVYGHPQELGAVAGTEVESPAIPQEDVVASPKE